jgi:hypothetical protein
MSDIESDGKTGSNTVSQRHVTLSASTEVEQQLREEVASLRQAVDKLLKRQAARDRDLHRASIGIPSVITSPMPVVSELTDPALPIPRSAPRGTRTRRSLGRDLGAADTDDDDNADIAYDTEAALTSAERDVIRKALRKMPTPQRFSGATDKEREEVVNWCQAMTNFLNAQFGDIPAKAPRMQIVLSLLDSPAAEWMRNIYSEADGMSWDELREPFIAFVRGGRDQRGIWKEQLSALSYGKGKCQDIITFNKEFDTLRLKLYPKSTFDEAMSVRSGEDYGDALRRGDAYLYADVLRILALSTTTEPKLKDWKDAAATAVQIKEVTRAATKAAREQASAARSIQRFRPLHAQTPLTAQHLEAKNQSEGSEEAWQREDGEEEIDNLKAVPKRPGGGGQTRKNEGYRLTEQERTRLMAAGKCFRCFGKGHLSSSAECPAKGKLQTKPTAEDLKA